MDDPDGPHDRRLKGEGMAEFQFGDRVWFFNGATSMGGLPAPEDLREALVVGTYVRQETLRTEGPDGIVVSEQLEVTRVHLAYGDAEGAHTTNRPQHAVFADRAAACAWAQERIRDYLRDINALRERWGAEFVEAL
jgi:hypothetical protein